MSTSFTVSMESPSTNSLHPSDARGAVCLPLVPLTVLECLYLLKLLSAVASHEFMLSLASLTC